MKVKVTRVRRLLAMQEITMLVLRIVRTEDSGRLRRRRGLLSLRSPSYYQ